MCYTMDDPDQTEAAPTKHSNKPLVEENADKNDNDVNTLYYTIIFIMYWLIHMN